MATLAESVSLAVARRSLSGATTLNSVARLWFAVAFVGQLLFVVHIVSFYAPAAAAGDFARWNKALAIGWVAGDEIGNAALAVHLLMAAAITFGGLMQLVPLIRQRLPVLHRWTGRAYIVSAFLASGSALYLLLIRGGTAGGFFEHLGIFINAVLILIFAVVALRYARARRFDLHRRWALRLFLVVSGVWFFRVGLFFWILINRGPVGFDPDTFSGPALIVLSFAQYLLPLAALELYLRARDAGGAARRFAAAGTLLLLTLVTGVGIFSYTAFLVSSGHFT